MPPFPRVFNIIILHYLSQKCNLFCNYLYYLRFLLYGSMVTFRKVFFVNRVHRKPENVGAKSCKAWFLCIAKRVAVNVVNSNLYSYIADSNEWLVSFIITCQKKNKKTILQKNYWRLKKFRIYFVEDGKYMWYIYIKIRYEVNKIGYFV